jgi:hypothetical protein
MGRTMTARTRLPNRRVFAFQYGVPPETIRRALLKNAAGNPSSPWGVALVLVGDAP